MNTIIQKNKIEQHKIEKYDLRSNLRRIESNNLRPKVLDHFIIKQNVIK